MDTVMQCAAVAVIGAVLCLFTRQQGAVFSTLVSLAVVLILSASAMAFLRPVFTFASTLRETASLGSGIVLPVVKAMGIGFLTEIGKNICQDAGENAIASVLQMVGGIAGIYVMLPLMESVLSLLETML